MTLRERHPTTGITSLSGGYRRRLAIARALVNTPDLLLMDEPTTGLDPSARRLVWERTRDLKNDGMTMVLTTHFMEEAEQLCDRIVVMNAGIIVTEGSPRELISAHAGHEVVELTLPAGQSGAAFGLENGENAHRRADLGGRTLLYSRDSDDTDRIVQGIPAGLRNQLLVRRASLDDVYTLLTGRELRELAGEEVGRP